MSAAFSRGAAPPAPPSLEALLVLVRRRDVRQQRRSRKMPGASQGGAGRGRRVTRGFLRGFGRRTPPRFLLGDALRRVVHACLQAERLVKKAQRMFPSAQGEALARACRLPTAPGNSGEGFVWGEEKASTEVRRRRTEGPAEKEPPLPRSRTEGFASRKGLSSTQLPRSSSDKGGAASHTPEQERLCESVMRETCYYKTLGVARSAPEEAIRRAYRKARLSRLPLRPCSPIGLADRRTRGFSRRVE